MRITAYILCIITLLLILCGCNDTVVDYSDEILSFCWYVNNESGVSAELSFDRESGMAIFNVQCPDKEKTQISGTYSIDKHNLYISDSYTSTLYTFAYKVYANRLILIFYGEELTMAKKEP